MSARRNLIAGILAGRSFLGRKRKSLTIDEIAAQVIAEIRDAIQAYRDANEDAIPGADGSSTTLKTDLQPYIDPFPAAPVGNQNANVKMSTGFPFVGGPEGWHYSYDDGGIIYNSDDVDDNFVPYSSY